MLLSIPKNGCVAKTLGGARWARKLSFLLSLSRHSKQAGDEGDLPNDVSFAYTSDLSLANHVHDLVSLQRSLVLTQKKMEGKLEEVDP